MSILHYNWFKYFKNLFIGVGAGFIIIGALFKIMHWKNANEILIYAMLFEASIFFLQAIIPPHKDYYWEKLYPGLDNVNAKVSPLIDSGTTGNNTMKLDKALDQAGVNDNLIKRLGTHLTSLTDNLGQLGEVTGTAGVTADFTKNAKAASDALSKVSASYTSAANVANDLAVAAEDTKKYQTQVQLVSKNLAALNAVYELELQDTNNHLKAMNKFYNNLTSAIENLNESVDDTKKYRENLTVLNRNLGALNNVYGNMLTAMAMGANAANTPAK